MSNWKAGDKALCVEGFNGMANLRGGGRRPVNSDRPQVGQTYLVTSVNHSEISGACLSLAGMVHVSKNGYVAYKFRKIVPACDRISQEQEGLIPHEGFFEGRPDL